VEQPSGTERPPTVSVVTVAYGAEPWLERSVRSSLDSADETVEVVLVDNGCTDGAVDRLAGVPGVRVLRPADNTGFAGGCAEGAAVARGDVLAFINPDAVVEPDCLHALAREVRSGVGIATASVRLADRPDHLNSAGNVVHFLGLSWSGAFDEPAGDHADRRPVAAASGAGMAMAKGLYERLGGFEPAFFAYQEDADLSVRCWQSGHPVVYVPAAVVVHRYEFSRNTGKFYLLDRNRLVFVLSTYSGPMLALLSPLLVVQELAIWALAAKEGWLPEKRRSVAWVLRHAGWVRRRRRALSALRTAPDAEWIGLLAVDLTPGNMATPAVVERLGRLLGAYWKVVCRLLGGRAGRGPARSTSGPS